MCVCSMWVWGEVVCGVNVMCAGGGQDTKFFERRHSVSADKLVLQTITTFTHNYVARKVSAKSGKGFMLFVHE